MDHLGLIYEESQIEYGKHSHITKSYGDPFGVHQHQKPVTDSKERWVGTVQNDASARTALERSLGGLSDEDLQAYGYPRDGSLNLFTERVIQVQLSFRKET